MNAMSTIQSLVFLSLATTVLSKVLRQNSVGANKSEGINNYTDSNGFMDQNDDVSNGTYGNPDYDGKNVKEDNYKAYLPDVLNEEQTNNVKPQLQVLTRAEYFQNNKLITLLEDTTYYYHIGRPIELTCEPNLSTGKSSSLVWMDDFGFSTIPRRVHENEAIQLRMIPDEFDKTFQVTCVSYPTKYKQIPNKQRNITIKFTQVDLPPHFLSQYNRNLLSVPIYIKEGDSLVNNETCNGIMYDALSYYVKGIFPPNKVIIDNFMEHLNGTIVMCVTYPKLVFERNNQTKLSSVIYERRKLKMTLLYLKPERDMNNNSFQYISRLYDGTDKERDHTKLIRTQFPDTSTETEFKYIQSNKETSYLNTGLIFFAIIATIIIVVNLTVLIIICVRKKRLVEAKTQVEENPNRGGNECEYHHYESIQETFIRLPAAAYQSSFSDANATGSTSTRAPCPLPKQEENKPYVHYDTPYEWKIFKRGFCRLSGRFRKKPKQLSIVISTTRQS